MTSVGSFKQQPAEYKTFIPVKFPARIQLTNEVILANERASLAVGKLDGVAQLVPSVDFFIYMYIAKEGTLSSNIEGTKATMSDAIRSQLDSNTDLPDDVENITHYIKALRYGLEQQKNLPLATNLIKKIHKVLLRGTNDGLNKTPGEFRRSQNWIGGTRPGNADFVPPPHTEINRCFSDLDVFLNDSKRIYPALVSAALVHSQFETIHPFLDGNGRIGRLLITLQLCYDRVLEYPILYLSEYFKQHRQLYFDKLTDYRTVGKLDSWLLFFLEGVETVSQKAVKTCKQIVKLDKQNRNKISQLTARQSITATKLLDSLYSQPIVDVAKVQTITGLSRPAAAQLVYKFIKIGILRQSSENTKYARQFSHNSYLNIFIDEQN